MLKLPRVAVGTVQPAAEVLPMAWALGSVLERADMRVQIFQSKARFGGRESGHAICGLAARHLDSWLMSPELCRESFAHGSRDADLAVVLGHYDTQRAARSEGGNLNTLCQWLDLPQLAIVDVPQLVEGRLPVLPSGTAGLLLDRVGQDDAARWQTILEPLLNVPVLGALPPLSSARKMMAGLAAGDSPSECLCETLATPLAETFQFEAFLRATACKPLPTVGHWVFRPGTRLAGLHIALAYDEAFHCYFPDVLDLLELQGATVRDFSPLHDEALPADSDIVYFGCGQPHRFARTLAANQCLALALRNYVCQGGRVYAEGGGLAYLCSQLELPDGKRLPMAGVVPAVAALVPDSQPPAPAELTVTRGSWLAPRGSVLRGYCNNAWQFRPTGPQATADALAPGQSLDLIAHQQAIGSRLQMDFAAQPDFLRRFASNGACSPRATFVR
jgi:cobyrinic acid a,c-diamide synthase